MDTFLSGAPSPDQGHGRFGQLTLPTLEKLAEAWAQELYGHWIEAKTDVSQRSALQSEIPDYLGISTIFGFFERQPSKTLSDVRLRMEGLLDAAEKASRKGSIQLLDRIAVVFQSDGAN